jgi:hypothetical protein
LRYRIAKQFVERRVVVELAHMQHSWLVLGQVVMALTSARYGVTGK